MDYREIIRLIRDKFNNVFETSYDIEYSSREKIVRTNPRFNIGKNTAGFYDTRSKQIYIISDVIERIKLNNSNKNYDQGLTFLIQAVFHELEHAIQKEHPEKLKKQFEYSKVMYDIEKLILMMRGADGEVLDLDYRTMHDNFLLEIDADIKGVNNAKNFVKAYSLNGINTRYYDLMYLYNEFRIDRYDIPLMINQFLKIVKKYPEILRDKRWLNNDELVSFFNKEGKLRPIEELMNIRSKFTKYFVASEEFLFQNNIKNMNGSQKIFVNDCIKRVIVAREEKDKRIRKIYIENVVEELKKYGLNPNSSSKNCKPMASKKYYNMLREYGKTIEDNKIGVSIDI